MEHKLIAYDGNLAPFAADLTQRAENYIRKKKQLLKKGQTLSDFANGHEYFGFHKTTDGWYYREWAPAADGMYLTGEFCNTVISLAVKEHIDVGSHGLFICEVTEARVLSDKETMTYTYYQDNVKPKPEKKLEDRKIIGWRCKICKYVYEGSELPADYACPLCGHGAEDFEPIYG